MSWFCKHKWEKVSETTLPSAYEQIAAAGQEPGTLRGATAMELIFRKAYVMVAQCVDCGEIRKFETVNP